MALRRALAGGVTLLALAGCGGTSSSSTVSPAQFSASLTAVCHELNRAAGPVSKDPSRFAAVVTRYIPRFQALTPPPSLRSTYSRYIAGISQLVSALKSRNAPEIQQLVPRVRTLTDRLGAPECGR